MICTPFQKIYFCFTWNINLFPLPISTFTNVWRARCTFRRARSGFRKDSVYKVHAALLTMCAAVMPYRHFTELKRRIFRPVRWCYFIRCTDKSKSCFALLCCFCACFQALSPLLPCENCKNTENKEIFTFSGKCCTKNKRTFCAIWRLDCPAPRLHIIYI